MPKPVNRSPFVLSQPGEAQVMSLFLTALPTEVFFHHKIILAEAYWKICLSKDIYLTAGCSSGCCFQQDNICQSHGYEELRDDTVFTGSLSYTLHLQNS